MDWQAPLILLCTHLAALGLGVWIGEKSLRDYKRRMYRRLYGGIPQDLASRFRRIVSGKL